MFNWSVGDCTLPSCGVPVGERKAFCDFGITESLAGILAGGLGSLGLGGGLIGTAAAPGLLATGLAGAGLGAAGGAALSGIEGKPIGQGALFGGLTGGAVAGVGPALGGALGGGTGANLVGDVAAGAGAGALGGKLTGQSPLSGALQGGAVGGVAGLGGVGSTSTPSTASPSITPESTLGATPGASAAAVGTPATASPVLGPSASGGGNFMGMLSEEPAGAAGTAPVGAVTTNALTGAPSIGGGFNSPDIATAGGAAPTGAATAAAPTAAGGSVLDKALSSLSSNPLPLLAGGGLLLESALQKPISQTPEAKPLEAAAGRTGALGANLSSYLQTGTLPPGAAAAVNNATAAEKANIRSSFASLGLTGSTMEAQALNQADQNKAAQTFQIGDQLLSQGAQFTNISDQLYQQILQETLQQDQAFQQALGTFASGLAGAGTRASNASVA